MTTIHHRQWRKLRDRVVREEPNCWLRLDGCTRVTTTADHVVPQSQRPDLTMVRSNLRGSCASCNMRRGNKTIAQLRAGGERATAPPPALRFFG
jgi:5-methylcytosine-specific restriction endonuclease McrA